MDFHDLVGGYDFHWYDARFDWEKGHTISAGAERLAEWAKWSHARDKGVFITELGTRAFGGGGNQPTHPGPNSYEAALQNAELVVRGIAAGADAFNRWSFNNRGDLDGQFQMVDTWDREHNRLRTDFTACPNAYFVYGLLSRFTAKHSAVLASSVDGGRVDDLPRVFATALRSPRGNLTLAVLNDAPTAWDATWQLRGLAGQVRLFRYAVWRDDRDRPDLAIEPQAEFLLSPAAPQFSDRVKPSSVTVYATYRLRHGDPGIIGD
jgi:hypothetical protein